MIRDHRETESSPPNAGNEGEREERGKGRNHNQSKTSPLIKACLLSDKITQLHFTVKIGIKVNFLTVELWEDKYHVYIKFDVYTNTFH